MFPPPDLPLRTPGTTAGQRATAGIPCGWCLGAGKYLERLDADVEHEYLPVVCESCQGTGRRPV